MSAPIGAAPPRRRGVAWAVLVAVALAALVTGGVVLALFSAQASTPGGVVVNGDLRLDPDPTSGSTLSWIETTPEIAPADRASGADAASLESFRGVPGDTVEVRLAVRTTLAGDNISAVVRATLTGALPAGVSAAGYRVLDVDGAVLAPSTGYTALGDATTLTELQSAGDERLLIAIELEWTGSVSSLTYTPDVTVAGPPTVTGVPVLIALEQVREGAGFVP